MKRPDPDQLAEAGVQSPRQAVVFFGARPQGSRRTRARPWSVDRTGQDMRSGRGPRDIADRQ